MSRTNRSNHKGSRGNGRQERHISVRGVRRDLPDLRKLSRAVIALALAEAEAEAQAQQTSTADTDDTPVETSPGDTNSEADHERT